MRRLLWLLSCLGAFVWVAPRARADRVVEPVRIESARGVALGTGVRAAASSSQAQADNPANLVLGGAYHMEGFASYDPNLKRYGVGGSIVDSVTSRVAAGASVRGLFGDNDAGGSAGYEGRLSLGIPIVDMLSIGVAGRFSNLYIGDPHAKPERTPMPGQTPDQKFHLKHFTMDVAATLRPVTGLAISALAYNLVDTKSPLAPMTVGGSVAFSISQFTIGGDALVDLNKQKLFSGPKLTIGGGIEYLASGVAPLRLGYAYDMGRSQSFVTAGLGYIAQRFGVQVSLRQSAGGQQETSLFLGLQYFVQ